MPESNNGTNLDALLHAALLCGMPSRNQAVHRYQLFFLVQGHLERRVGTNDLQRTLETATQNGIFAKAAEKQDGRYMNTAIGLGRALQTHGGIKAVQAPAAPGECRFSVLSPPLAGHSLEINVTDGRFYIARDGRRVTGKAALDWLNKQFSAAIPRSNDSQARRVYDYAVGEGWPFVWQGEPANSGEPTAEASQLASEVAALRSKRKHGNAMPSPQGNPAPEQTPVTTLVWRRLASVVEHVLNRAGGRCESCGAIPFVGDDDDVFLEVHHVRTLADRGPDTICNAVALCPNCHRAFHYAADRKSRIEAVYQRVPALKRY